MVSKLWTGGKKMEKGDEEKRCKNRWAWSGRKWGVIDCAFENLVHELPVRVAT
jgi:hypothetical protein